MRPVRWLDDRVLWLRDQLTPGQRWTAALAVGLVVLVFSVGLPDHVVVRSGRAAAASPNAATGAGAGAAVASSNQGGTQSPSPVLGLATTAAPSGDAGSTATPEPETELVASTPAPAATVVALVRPGNDSLPGRGDADAARVFLAQAPFKAVTVQLTGDNAHDCQAASVASVALASEGLPAALGDCLAAAGVALVSADHQAGRKRGL